MALKNSIDSCKTCVSGWKRFRILTKTEFQHLNENRYEASFKPGELMVKQDFPTSNVLFLSSGFAKVYIEGNNSRNFIVTIAKPGQLILGPGAWVSARNTYTVSALSPVRACFISFEVFRKLTRENALFGEAMLEELSLMSLRSNERIVSLAHKKMAGRLADALLFFSDELFGSDEFEMLLSRQELGEMTNMAKECVVRIIKDFEDDGLVSSSSSGIRILDKKRITELSEKG